MLHILSLLALPCLLSLAEARGRGGGRGGGKGGSAVFLCFGEGCSGLDITLTCLSIVLIVVTMCRCLRDCAKCCDGGGDEEDESQYYETA